MVNWPGGCGGLAAGLMAQSEAPALTLDRQSRALLDHGPGFRPCSSAQLTVRL